MTQKINWWLSGVGFFTALIFGVLAYVSYRAYVLRGEGYYLASVLVYGGVALFSVVAVINGWRNRLPGQQRAQETPVATSEGSEPPTDA